jgi:XTP/dITP diphosphohydrolase
MPDWEIEPLDADEFPPEEGETYYENARAKARFGRAVGAADAWMIGEDSGIEVAGLGGSPGVHSARFAGGDPVGRLLAELERVDDRRARYVCELLALSPDGVEVRGTGVLEGTIARGPAGNQGFGFDPVFVPRGESTTVAELGDAWKAQHSHRALAARALRDAV